MASSLTEYDGAVVDLVSTVPPPARPADALHLGASYARNAARMIESGLPFADPKVAAAIRSAAFLLVSAAADLQVAEAIERGPLTLPAG